MSNVTPQPLVETTERYLMVAPTEFLHVRLLVKSK